MIGSVPGKTDRGWEKSKNTAREAEDFLLVSCVVSCAELLSVESLNSR